MKPSINVNIDQIFIRKDETFTVYVQNELDSKWIQIEIRCLKNGKPELYCDGLTAKSFDVWKSKE